MTEDQSAHVPEYIHQRDGYGQLLLDRYDQLREICERYEGIIDSLPWADKHRNLTDFLLDLRTMRDRAKQEIDNL